MESKEDRERRMAQARSRKYHASHREVANRNTKAYVDRLRDKAHTMLGGKCCRCGNEDRRVLQIDHINGDGGEERKAANNLRKRLLAVISRDGEGCQLVCANCHLIEEWERRNEVV